jgi:hypothetical protein
MRQCAAAGPVPPGRLKLAGNFVAEVMEMPLIGDPPDFWSSNLYLILNGSRISKSNQ